MTGRPLPCPAPPPAGGGGSGRGTPEVSLNTSGASHAATSPTLPSPACGGGARESSARQPAIAPLQRRQIDERDAHPFLVDARQRAVLLALEHPGIDPLQKIVVARL